MRHFLLLLPTLGAVACLNTTAPQAIPIDCGTLATSVAASEPTLTTTASGLKYRDVTVGTGATAVATGNVIFFHYSGCLVPSGTKFDENTNVNQAAMLQVGTPAIAGFTEGVIGMKAGGRRQLVIPPNLAYGAQGAKDVNGNVVVPPNSTIVFTIDLIGVQ